MEKKRKLGDFRFIFWFISLFIQLFFSHSLTRLFISCMRCYYQMFMHAKYYIMHKWNIEAWALHSVFFAFPIRMKERKATKTNLSAQCVQIKKGLILVYSQLWKKKFFSDFFMCVSFYEFILVEILNMKISSRDVERWVYVQMLTSVEMTIISLRALRDFHGWEVLKVLLAKHSRFICEMIVKMA